MNLHLKRYTRAQTIVELVVGILFLIPICLFLVDMAALILSNTVNDDLCKRAAHAAGAEASAADARAVVEQIVTRFDQQSGKSGLISKPKLKTFRYDEGSLPGQVVVGLETNIRLPIPVPFFPNLTSQTFKVQHVEPIVAKPPI
jgi:hypothetical protein